MEETPANRQAVTAKIICAYVSNNKLTISDLPNLVVIVSDTLAALGQTAVEPAPSVAPMSAAQIKRSIRPGYIVCFEDNRPFKTLKRHLWTSYGMTPEQYREKWGLPFDYPMVAPNLSSDRSRMAKSHGFRNRKKKAKSRSTIKG